MGNNQESFLAQSSNQFFLENLHKHKRTVEFEILFSELTWISTNVILKQQLWKMYLQFAEFWVSMNNIFFFLVWHYFVYFQ